MASELRFEDRADDDDEYVLPAEIEALIQPNLRSSLKPDFILARPAAEQPQIMRALRETLPPRVLHKAFESPSWMDWYKKHDPESRQHFWRDVCNGDKGIADATVDLPTCVRIVQKLWDAGDNVNWNDDLYTLLRYVFNNRKEDKNDKSHIQSLTAQYSNTPLYNAYGIYQDENSDFSGIAEKLTKIFEIQPTGETYSRAFREAVRVVRDRVDIDTDLSADDLVDDGKKADYAQILQVARNDLRFNEDAEKFPALDGLSPPTIKMSPWTPMV